jgi:hypothetical protein
LLQRHAKQPYLHQDPGEDLLRPDLQVSSIKLNTKGWAGVCSVLQHTFEYPEPGADEPRCKLLVLNRLCRDCLINTLLRVSCRTPNLQSTAECAWLPCNGFTLSQMFPNTSLDLCSTCAPYA